MTFYEWWTTQDHPDVINMRDAELGWHAALQYADITRAEQTQQPHDTSEKVMERRRANRRMT